jgi:hypothetical protein
MMAGLNHLRKHTRDPPSGQAAVQGLSVGRPPLQGSVGSRAAAPLFESPVYSLRNVMRVLQTAPRVRHLETDKRRGGSGFSDTGVSGVLCGQYSNRRADIHEKAKT